MRFPISLLILLVPHITALRLGEKCTETEECRTEVNVGAYCHPVLQTCLCPASERVAPDGETCVPRGELVIVQHRDTPLARKKTIPKNAQTFEEIIIQAALKKTVEEHQKSLQMKKEDTVSKELSRDILLEAVKQSLSEYDISEKSIEKAVMRSISERKRAKLHHELDLTVQLSLLILGCLGLATCLTFIYLKKLKEKKNLRQTQYSTTTTPHCAEDKNKFVAEKYMAEINESYQNKY